MDQVAVGEVQAITAGRGHPGVVLGAVEAVLRQQGLNRIYGAACTLYGVLSVAPDVTVWCDGRRLWWREGDEETGWPAADPEGAARQLAGLARKDDGS
jgi:hypothetical protein